jgi:uncharacterized protein
MDLSDPAATPEIERELNRQALTPDVLVNNAGFGLRGPFTAIDLGKQLQMIQVNVRALTYLTGLCCRACSSGGAGACSMSRRRRRSSQGR